MADRTLIAIGMKCPRPLFEISKAIKELEAGQVLEAAADDPAFRLDIEAWCRRTGHVLIDLRDEPDRLVAVIKKAIG